MTGPTAYTPPCTVSERAVNLVADISAAIERYHIAVSGVEGLRLRKINRIKTIRGSTAIEGNTLTEEQITAVLEGKRVAAPKKEIDEVLGAAAAYEQIEQVDPYNLKDILKVHKLMMGGLVDAAGSFRRGQVGVIDGSGNVLHMAPPASQVPTLMACLFEWLDASEAHPLVKSSVFHYEFEFIHPFADGNGRTGRYWQTAILGKWKSAFYAAPIENIVWENQAGYYLAIRRSSLIGDSGPFLDFMLERILQAIRTKGEEGRDVGVNVGVNVGEKLSERESKLLDMLRHDGSLTAAEIAGACSISTRQAERLLASLKKKNLLRRVGPDKGGHWEVVS
jgi:Fic family protein